MIPILTYGSVCSGIEAASLAWEPLGLCPLWFAEVEEFPSMVLAERWPTIPNLGDMTLIADRILSGDIPAPDVLVGGTPCQDFSLAGLRKGMKGERGQLTLAYVELADAIDTRRAEEGKPPVIILWENVPGVFSDHENAYGNFLAALAGEYEPFEPGPRPAAGKSADYWVWSKKTHKHFPKWSKHGAVIGRKRRLGWTTKDAQFFGVAQRRRRCFVVASARTDIDPTTLFFESGSVCRDTPPSRETGALSAADVGACAPAGIEPLVMAHGQAGAEINVNLAPTLTCNHEQPIMFNSTGQSYYQQSDVAATIRAGNKSGCAESQLSTLLAFPAQMSSTQYASADYELSQTIQSHNPTAICYPAQGMAFAENQRGEIRFIDGDGQVTSPIQCSGGKPGQGYQVILQSNMVVRRLTAVECERLQGMPDNHTLIPVHKVKKLVADEIAYLKHHCPQLTDDMIFKMAKDGPRYKAIGNSMAVPVMRWLMEQVLQHLQQQQQEVKVKEQKEKQAVAYVRPFLKWAGGKFSVLDDIFSVLPPGLRLVEPFVGAGSVFLNADRRTEFMCHLLGDVNADLIHLYQMLAVAPMAVIDCARNYFDNHNNADNFDDLKKAFNEYTLNAIERAAAFVYINRHCFNGLTRYNLKGEFNVGYGRYKDPYFPEHEMLQFVALANHSVFINAPFQKTIGLCGEGDVIYCDPPYEPLPGKDGFTSYSGGSFKWADQLDLAAELVRAHQRGAKVVVTNSGAPKIRELYEASGFTLYDLHARRSISSKASTRETAHDVLGVLL